jgi:hypothetical protein
MVGAAVAYRHGAHVAVTDFVARLPAAVQALLVRGIHLLVLALQLAKLDWEDPRVWEEQLTGVDFAYFREVIERIRVLLKEGKGMAEIVSTYLVQIVEETI